MECLHFLKISYEGKEAQAVYWYMLSLAIWYIDFLPWNVPFTIHIFTSRGDTQLWLLLCPFSVSYRIQGTAPLLQILLLLDYK